MALGHRRRELQSIAQVKLTDARLLMSNGSHSNAYYLAGYAVEIGLKACIARQIRAEAIPDKNFINDAYTHDIRKLAKLAGLTKALTDHQRINSAFGVNWALVSEWTPDSRYRPTDKYTAQLMVDAVGDINNGVLIWIGKYW